MTNYPECILARELELCYVNISLITDYDVGVAGDPSVDPVSHEAVLRVFQENNERLRGLLAAIVAGIPTTRECRCAQALATARIE
jgi:5'-methylthioadenosine phosphorylase